MDEKIPLVSIACVVYNQELFIQQCIDGFLMQRTTFTIEIIIHDDASTDNTTLVLKEYADKFPQLVLPIFQTENQYSKGINPGFEFVFPKCRGKYIALCEGDDYWIDPYKLQKQVDFLEENPEYSLCFHNALLLFTDKDTSSNPFKKLEEREYTGEEILQEWTIPTASVIFRKDACDVKKLNNPNYFYGDIILFLTLAEKGKLWCINEPMCIYRKHAGGMTSQKDNLLVNIKKFIKHHEEIQIQFGGKYEIVEQLILCKNYISLSKKQLKHFDISFISTLIKAFNQNSRVFFSCLIKSYLKI